MSLVLYTASVMFIFYVIHICHDLFENATAKSAVDNLDFLVNIWPTLVI